MTISQFYIDFKNKLKTIYDDRESDNIADWAFENATGLKKLERRLNGNHKLNEIDYNHLQKYLKELLEHKPVQYVLQETWFYKRKFFINENVLIPRPETEELVEWIINDSHARNQHSKPTNMIDIGTGSGCIAVSLKKELASANITAIDVSEKALKIAKKNASGFNTPIGFLEINFLDETEWKDLKTYDVIVSNPPYIPAKEKNIMAKNVTEFEPSIALFVDNNDPFIFYKKITGFAKRHLNKNGKIYVEVHENYSKEVKDIFEKSGFASEIRKDIYGNARMVKAG
ncbi:MAG: peptide chain release factor N(5)-glutamine methyltransferase [Ginsengibacter sp.]